MSTAVLAAASVLEATMVERAGGVRSLFPSAACLVCPSLFYLQKFISIILVLASMCFEGNGLLR